MNRPDDAVYTLFSKGSVFISTLQTVQKRIKSNIVFYLMFTIPFLYFVVFHYIPMFGVVIAFKKYNVYEGIINSPWVGIKYFKEFLSDSYFYRLLRNTILLGLYQIIFVFPAPIMLALLLNEVKNKLFKKFVQTVSYLPHFLSTVVVVGMLVNILSFDGILNTILQWFGAESRPFIMLPEWFRTIYISSEIWQSVGWGSIIYLAALTAIDPQLYEAASIDGANRWHKILHVTLPGISSTIIILFIFQCGGILSVSFEKILLLYTGTTYETADVISTYVYRRGLVSNDFSYATAVGLFNALIAFMFLFLANRLSKKYSETSLW